MQKYYVVYDYAGYEEGLQEPFGMFTNKSDADQFAKECDADVKELTLDDWCAALRTNKKVFEVDVTGNLDLRFVRKGDYKKFYSCPMFGVERRVDSWTNEEKLYGYKALIAAEKEEEAVAVAMEIFKKRVEEFGETDKVVKKVVPRNYALSSCANPLT